ncbi:hypothetical protein QJS83_03340 [Bdellovibrio sp. 22V]|uniref:hypothetical protein n=1 Tax=Bdellovibrio TaxID=958 RepID=UPI0025439BB4|nr:hypothetical protein [Bdellovibrio sp. 22V]WII72904.1 hypothetical protein QJS83_03340 [Bdellovibrio sp. 22V]
MRQKLRQKFSIIVLLMWGTVMTQLYQNCAPLNMQGFEMASSEVVIPQGHDEGSGMGSHPVDNTNTKIAPTRKQLVANRTYVAGIFREVFTSTKYPISNLEALIDKWIEFKGAQYGGACNLYSSYSSRDCSGSLANTNIGHYTEDNTVRESFRIQMCENVLGADAGVNAALEKVGLTTASAISTANVAAAYGLFYRNDPPEELVVNSLLDLNQTLAAKKVSAMDRWRAILSQVCESPAWQLF